MEKREYRRGSHADQISRKCLSESEVFTKVSEELNDFTPSAAYIRFRSMPVSTPNIERFTR